MLLDAASPQHYPDIINSNEKFYLTTFFEETWVQYVYQILISQFRYRRHIDGEEFANKELELLIKEIPKIWEIDRARIRVNTRLLPVSQALTWQSLSNAFVVALAQSYIKSFSPFRAEFITKYELDERMSKQFMGVKTERSGFRLREDRDDVLYGLPDLTVLNKDTNPSTLVGMYDVLSYFSPGLSLDPFIRRRDSLEDTLRPGQAREVYTDAVVEGDKTGVNIPKDWLPIIRVLVIRSIGNERLNLAQEVFGRDRVTSMRFLSTDETVLAILRLLTGQTKGNNDWRDYYKFEELVVDN